MTTYFILVAKCIDGEFPVLISKDLNIIWQSRNSDIIVIDTNKPFSYYYERYKHRSLSVLDAIRQCYQLEGKGI